MSAVKIYCDNKPGFFFSLFETNLGDVELIPHYTNDNGESRIFSNDKGEIIGYKICTREGGTFNPGLCELLKEAIEIAKKNPINKD